MSRAWHQHWEVWAGLAALVLWASTRKAAAAPALPAPANPLPLPVSPAPSPIPSPAPVGQWLAINNPRDGNIMQQGRRYKYSDGNGRTLRASMSDLSGVAGVANVTPSSVAPIGGFTSLEFVYRGETGFKTWPDWMFADGEKLAVWA